MQKSHSSPTRNEAALTRTHEFGKCPDATGEILVYDCIPDGHRENYVRLLADLLEGQQLIGPWAEMKRRLHAARNLMLPTFETAPALFTRTAILRALAGRRTTIIMMRMHDQPSNRRMMRLGRSAALNLMALFPQIQLLSITPVPSKLHGSRLHRRIQEVADPEFWDVPMDVRRSPPETDLSQEARRIAGDRSILLAIGTIAEIKGLELLAAIQKAGGDEFRRKIAVVCAGHAPDSEEPCVRKIMESADFVYPKFLTDDEIYSLYGVSSLIWCCYRPDYDMSSGIYGRARQFNRLALVRKGSLLATFADRDKAGLALAYPQPVTDTCARADATRILSWLEAPRPDDPLCKDDSARLRQLVLSHFKS
jgi:hypothetical protein